MAQGKKRARAEPAESNGIDAEGAKIQEPPAKLQVQRRSLFVRSLPSHATDELLVAHFSEGFPIRHATAVLDPQTKLCKGYGFVTFADAEDAQAALEQFNDTLLEGRRIKLDIAEPRQRGTHGEESERLSTNPFKKGKEAKEDEPVAPPKLIVRNLPWSIKTPQDLIKLFQSYGKVKFATLPTKKPGLLSGFGIVGIKGSKNAEKALQELNGRTIDGRVIAVDWAVGREAWQTQLKDAERQQTTTESATVEHGEGDLGPSGLNNEDHRSQLEQRESDEAMSESEEGASEMEDEDSAGDAKTQEQDLGSTVFVRNLPFTCTDEVLNDHFSNFGKIRYARVVVDRDTERSKGTAFVCFFNADDAEQCIRNAPRRSQRPAGKPSAQETSQSVLQSTADDPSGEYTVDGRVLIVTKAVDRTEANRLTEENSAKFKDRDGDKRRLYLLSEGSISSHSPLYELLSPSDVSMRQASATQRKKLIESNPSLHISLTRLSVRNLPRSISSKELKALAREGVVEFAKGVKEGKRQALSKEELSRGGDAMKDAEQYRKRKGVGVVKQAKVVFEDLKGSKTEEASGVGRSRGYGFIEYHTHRNALMGLRWLNGHALRYQVTENKKNAERGSAQDKNRRLIVEFAIENAQVVNRRRDKELRSREKPLDKGNVSKSSSQRTRKSIFTIPEEKGNRKADESADTKHSTGEVNKSDSKLANRQRIIGKKRAQRRRRAQAGGKS